MPDKTLARRYRRLLAAYPGWHRRLHGPDMLRTLLDAAGDGRGVSRRAAALLVLDGMRCRFRVSGAGAVVLVASVSVVVASAVGAAVGWVGWRASIAPYPTVRQATALAAPVRPAGRPVSTTRVDADIDAGSGPADRLLVLVIGDPELTTGGVDLAYRPPHREPGAALREARQRLAARGWHVAPVDTWLGGWTLTADRGGYRVAVSAAFGETGRSDDVTVHVAPTPPAVAYRLAVVGAVVGLLAGWLAGAAVVAQARRRSRTTRTAAAVLAAIGAATSLPACVLGVLITVNGTAADGAPPWGAYDVVLARPGAAIGAVLLVVAAVLGAGTGSAGHPRTVVG